MTNFGRCRMKYWKCLANAPQNLRSSMYVRFLSARTLRTTDSGFAQLRNVTQTSITLEWSPLQLSTSKLRSLDIYKNRQRLASIPSPLQNTSTKLSGLELDMEYSIQLVLRTTGGTFPSNIVRVKTHTTMNTSGIRVCFGTIQDPELLKQAEAALQEMDASWSNKIQIDTTHFVCTTPTATPTAVQASGGTVGVSSPGVEYQRALQLSIPIVQPQWILACLTEKRRVCVMGVLVFFLTPLQNGTDPAVLSREPSDTFVIIVSAATIYVSG
jgi:hypothetical protein